MAAKAFLLIETVADKGNVVVVAIKQLREERVKWVSTVTGPYDIIAGLPFNIQTLCITAIVNPRS